MAKAKQASKQSGQKVAERARPMDDIKQVDPVPPGPTPSGDVERPEKREHE